MDYSCRGTATSTAINTPRPNTARSGDSFELTPINPFASAKNSYPSSTFASNSSLSGQPRLPTYFHSRRRKKGELERPWLEKKSPKEKWMTIIPLLGILLGVLLSGYLIWDGLQTVSHYKYCSVYETDFSHGLDQDVWTQEVEVGGFGNGQFDETTSNGENAFVKDGMLIIKPTLQDKNLVENNNVLNLLKNGQCTSHTWSDCVAVTNTTNGTIINPVKSARINTKAGASIKFGRVEVEARIPSGDWLWPAIWMLPVNSTYGPWPASGEIDIMESRGNNHTYLPQGGNNIVSSTLHWGPDPANDNWWQNNVKREALHTTYASGFYTYGLEWSDKYIFTYINNRLLTVLYTNFNKPFWEKGAFPPSTSNGTQLVDPWSQTGNDATPFDQDFYLILNVAVGGTNGWFQDGVAGKPWVDASTTAKLDFWNARSQWYPTWEGQGQMEVKSVKMWQQSGYNGCKA